MSARATAWAHAQRVGNSVRKLVLLAIADACDDEGFGYPSIKRLAWMAECDERTAQRAIRDLEAARLVMVDRARTRDGGGQTANGYRLSMAQLYLEEGGGGNLPPRQSAGPAERRSGSCVTPYEHNKTSYLSQRSLVAPLPDFIPRAAWEDFLADRRERRKPMTSRAQNMAIAELAKLHGQREDLEAVIRRSIRKGYDSFYPLPKDEKRTPGASAEAWWTSPEGIDRQGRKLGLQPKPRESYAAYADRIRNAMEPRP